MARPTVRKKIFLSYAHQDGADLAQRLRDSLKKCKHIPWLDKQRIDGGASWTREIETALDEAKVLLALLTPASYRSEICRAEQLRALRKGKKVIPILGAKGAEIPLHLETKHYRDFSDKEIYAELFGELLQDIRGNKGASLKDRGRETFRQTYVTAPPLPANFVPRPEALTKLRNALITDSGGERSIAPLAIQGMGGIGKTVLAQALCYDEVVQEAFPDGVIWVKAGKESAFSLVTQLREVGKALLDDLSGYDTEPGCVNHYRSTMRSKAALIIIDDVWSASAIEPLRAESPRSRLLFTTRNASIAHAIGAKEHRAELFSEAQAREVFTRWSGMNESPPWPEAEEIMRECRQLPLALSMVGAMLRGKPHDLWKRTLEFLQNADLEKIKVQFPDYPYPSLFAAIEVSVNALPPVERQRYYAMAVLLQEMPVARLVQQTLWGTDVGEAVETAEKLIDHSLAQREEEDGGGIRLHVLQLYYLCAQYPDQEALRAIHGAMRLASHVLARDPGQFTAQMAGRLLGHEHQIGIRQFVKEISAGAPRPWLRSQWPTLDQPGGDLLRTLHGHSGSLYGVAVIPDGRRAVSASSDKTLKVWDLDSGQELYTLQGHSDWVNSVAVTPDGRHAVSASSDSTLKVWDLDSGQEIRTYRGHSLSVNGVAISPDGRRAVSASDDKTLKVWNIDSGQELHTLIGHSDSTYSVAITPDGRFAVSCSRDNTLKVWDLESGQELRTLLGHSNWVNGVAITTDGRRALSASRDNTLKVWNLESGEKLHNLQGHSDAVNGVAVTRDGRRALSASSDNTLKVWDLESGQELHTLQGHSNSVYGVAVISDGKRAISASWDKTLKVWDLDKGHKLRTVLGHSGAVSSVAVTPGNGRAISASDDGTLKVWDLASSQELHTLHGHSGSVKGVAMTSDGQRAVSVSADNTLKLWDLGSGKELRTLEANSVYGVAVTPDGRRAVSASADNTLKQWDLESGQQQFTLKGHSRSVCGVAVTPDGRHAVSASWDHTLKVWDLDSGQELRTLRGHSGYVTGVAVTADGQHAISASADNTLKLWNLNSGKQLSSFKDHSLRITGVAVTPDGRRVVSASDDNTLKVWNLERLDEPLHLATFTCEGGVSCCAFVSTTRIFCGDAGGRIYLLELVL